MKEYIVIGLLVVVVILLSVFIALLCSRPSEEDGRYKKMKHYRRDVIINGGVDIAQRRLTKDDRKYFDDTLGTSPKTVVTKSKSADKNTPTHVLMLITEQGKVKLGRFFGQIIIGRNNRYSAESFLQLDEDRSVSTTHCRIYFYENSYYIEDTGSKNGTVLNGKTIEVGKAVVIKSGDHLKIGKTTYTVKFRCN